MHYHGDLHLQLHIDLFIQVILIIIIFFTVETSTENTTFSFAGFDSNMAEINFEGDAYADNQIIELTKNQGDIPRDGEGSVGRATYYKPMHLWDKASGNLADFNTHFSLVIRSIGNQTRADGIAFFLAFNGSQLSPSSEGGKLGLFTDQRPISEQPFVAVELDTYWNVDIDPVGIGDHIGINLNSISSVKYVNWTRNDISGGGRVNVSIYYDSSSKNLSITVRNGDNQSSSNNMNVYNLSCIADLKSYLPEWVIFGFSSATSPDFFERNQIYSWNFTSTLQIPGLVTPPSTPAGVPTPAVSRKRGSKSLLWGVVGAIALALIVSSIWFGLWTKKRKHMERNYEDTSINEDFEMETGPRSFSYEELAVATNNFGYERLLGQGGFGKVYAGSLNNGNSQVAVKKITSGSRQGFKEYASEVKTISRVRHRNLVQLIGWCRENELLLLVYEFMPNKSLDFHLFNKTGLLTWEKRYAIALGLASALLYLQEECDQCVLHRDIKSSNVLLDSNLNAKLCDFGLARLVEHGQESDTTLLMGTHGYVAPEYVESSRATKGSDVYSFGIVVLEIASGRPGFKEVRDDVRLVEWVWQHYGSGKIFAVADRELGTNYVEEEMERLIVVGLACAHPHYSYRLSIKEAIDILNAKAPLPILPLEMPEEASKDTFQLNMFALSDSSSLRSAVIDDAQSSVFTTSSSV